MTSTEANVDTTIPAVDLDVNKLPGQVASAVLDLKGNLVRGELSGNATSILFAMMQETGQLKVDKEKEGSIRRLTVTLSNTRYVVARDETHLYISEQNLE